ncbi:MAG: hypothetical protein LBR36_03300 [Bacteroidales bacterium]|nr:hypothetical protein [Bacteroidales bacterium]
MHRKKLKLVSIFGIAGIILGLFLQLGCRKTPISNRTSGGGDDSTIVVNPAELIIYNYDGGNVEWVSIQKGTSADAKLADAKADRNDIVQSNDTLYIQLYTIENDTVAFTGTDKLTVVLKHDKADKMYIKFLVPFKDGLADVKWGGWLPINS